MSGGEANRDDVLSNEGKRRVQLDEVSSLIDTTPESAGGLKSRQGDSIQTKTRHLHTTLVFLSLGSIQLLGHSALIYSMRYLNTALEDRSWSASLLGSYSFTVLVMMAVALLFLDCASRAVFYAGASCMVLGPLLFSSGLHYVADGIWSFVVLALASCVIGAGCSLMMLFSMATASNMPSGNYNNVVCNGIGISGCLSFVVWASATTGLLYCECDRYKAILTGWIFTGMAFFFTLLGVILYEMLMRTEVGVQLKQRLEENRVRNALEDDSPVECAKNDDEASTTAAHVRCITHPQNTMLTHRDSLTSTSAAASKAPDHMTGSSYLQMTPDPKATHTIETSTTTTPSKPDLLRFRFMNTRVLQAGWLLSLLGLLASLTTSAVYPAVGPLSWIKSERSPRGQLLLILYFGTFQLWDIMGRYSVGLLRWCALHTKGVAVLTIGRIVVVPFYVLCAVLKRSPFFGSIYLHLVLVSVVGLTNGWGSTACMQHLPDLVSRPSDKSKIVSLGLLLGFTGSTIGSWVATLTVDPINVLSLSVLAS